MRTCAECQHLNQSEDLYCRDCGAEISVGLWGLDWVWVIYGTTLITTLQSVILAVAGFTFLGDQLVGLFAAPSAGGFTWLMAQVGALVAAGYLLGGVLIGRLSGARTIVEPAISAGIPAIVLFVYVLNRAKQELFNAGLFWHAVGLAAAVVIFCFLVSLVGGYLGERWQQASRRKAIVQGGA